MGLFSKKSKELEYDAVECQNKKARMRQMFNEAVADGDSYKILHATETTTKFEHGLYLTLIPLPSITIFWDTVKMTIKSFWCKSTEI